MIETIGAKIRNRLTPYNVLVELGRGSYSRVWLVYCIVDSKYYAMKVQNPDDYTEGKDEINILKKIDKNELSVDKPKISDSISS